MHFNYAVIMVTLLSGSVLSVPLKTLKHYPRDLTLVSYNDLSISSGVAGNAEAEANAKIATLGLPSDDTQVSSADLETLNTERESAENAETDAFDPAIAAASGANATALQNGKIKNKVLKLALELKGLEIQQAQGDDVSSQITEETTKFNTDVATDKAAAGQASQAVSFTG